ncbi:MAG: hypothetical protein M1832_003624 [Thelocarpon impressellum]|nr:MAG: hypothetical protein M1832_003624 [Thelocarpon impressellum]
MVSLTEVQSSNSRIDSALPPGLVAVFVGGTRGIGEYTLRQFAKHARQARVYFVGRSQENGDRVAAECKALNPEGEYIFVKADTSLIRNVDDVCRDLKTKEKAINLLFLTTGTLNSGTETSEGLHFPMALTYYARTRFIANLLPLLQQATALRRVVTVGVSGKEGPLFTDDFQGWKVPILSQRGHLGSLLTLSLEALAQKAPDVSFIHDFPGPVKTDLARDAKGAVMAVLKVAFKIVGPFVYIPNEESGERHLFLATSARYPAGASVDASSGVPLADGLAVARGTTGESGSGVYSVGSDGESAGPKVEALLAQFRKDGTSEEMWNHTEGEFKRIAGS